jgi:hypothetical protein
VGSWRETLGRTGQVHPILRSISTADSQLLHYFFTSPLFVLVLKMYSRTSPALASSLITSMSPSRGCRRSSRVVQLSTSLSQRDNNGGRQRSLFLVLRLLTCITAVGGTLQHLSNHSSELVSANCSKAIFAFLHGLPLGMTTIVVQGKAPANHNFKG